MTTTGYEPMELTTILALAMECLVHSGQKPTMRTRIEVAKRIRQELKFGIRVYPCLRKAWNTVFAILENSQSILVGKDSRGNTLSAEATVTLIRDNTSDEDFVSSSYLFNWVSRRLPAVYAGKRFSVSRNHLHNVIALCIYIYDIDTARFAKGEESTWDSFEEALLDFDPLVKNMEREPALCEFQLHLFPGRFA